jgi:hypothetical protein
MTERVLRWLSATALTALVLVAAVNIGFLPSFVAHFPLGPGWGPAYVLGRLVLPTTAVAVCEVTGVATLVVSLQRKQWGWFVGALLCLLLHFYASLALAFPAGVNILYKLASSAYLLSIYLTLYTFLAVTPIALLALVYAWTRRYPPSASAATLPHANPPD